MFDEFDSYTPDFGEVKVTNDVYVRDNMGRFAAQVSDINAAATEDALRVGTQVARDNAPIGATGSLVASITYYRETPKKGVISVGTDHWRYMEYGTRPHPIYGWVSFFWEREGRRWTPGHNWIHHPGVEGRFFMAKGLEAARQELIDSMRRRYRELKITF